MDLGHPGRPWRVQHNFKCEELDLRGRSIKLRCGGRSRGENLIVESGVSCWGDCLLITLVEHWIKVHQGRQEMTAASSILSLGLKRISKKPMVK